MHPFTLQRPQNLSDALAGLGHGNAARRAGQKANAKPRLECATATSARRSSKLPRCIYRSRLWVFADYGG